MYAYLPVSVQESMTYNQIPLIYAMSCSIALSLLYKNGRVEYYFANYDLVLDEIPFIKSLNPHRNDYYMERADSFYKEIDGVDYARSHREGWTCRLNVT